MKKLPKTKTGLYLVERTCLGDNGGIPIGIFVTEDAANDYAGACEQNMKDHGVTAFMFRTVYVMFYNE